jgi:NADPH:quinone reductase-like Zn-dependent oxidoreductase
MFAVGLTYVPLVLGVGDRLQVVGVPAGVDAATMVQLLVLRNWAAVLKELTEAEKYRAVIDRCYPLEDVVDATRYVETEQKTGNVVLTVNGGRVR